MHIADGALSGPVLIAGGVLSLAGLGIGLRKLDMETIPATGVLSATFFVASLIHFPVGASSVHLIMNGLAGLVLGWAAFPALAVALLLQAIFFGFGGVTVLGINTFNIAAAAVLMHYLCRRGIMANSPSIAAMWGAAAGAGAIVVTTVLVALSLALSGEQFIPAAQVTVLVHIPVMIIEGAVTAAAVYLVRKVKPELFTAISNPRGETRHG
ncbi:cobalt transporter CbiM [Pelagibacterium halotolerans]|uniref:Substrate-specific component NikM of nickel ECF transporter n=1 Tax=Pelagibacterium halotolerans (strain DSM 22347 / JCM 15775 / CGMCC 1.7692 / B2) TaxID=1082931 RepID=G4R723_PELHB|nr:cobalt transporter CbiM [Pelagibacterium halotolerans]AEQ50177.1 substrate-specific component NikM of nickel ECF transporter [Pelagibacterium halotolerans B2]QJR19815.1 cobalt transporter CbiM [Pelagibacterium halotolerans]SEA49833.1 cobalt/nickel transport system permease protein [Pelagibacterium halotolerans]